MQNHHQAIISAAPRVAWRWTEEGEARCKEHYDAGLSSAAIAAALMKEFRRCGSLTRNAVIGKIHRKGWKRATRSVVVSVPSPSPRRGSAITQRRRQASRMTFLPPLPEPLPPAAPPTLAPDDVPGTIALLDLGHGMCRWPSGDRDVTYCGAPVMQRHPYCEAHAARAYSPAAMRRFTLPRRRDGRSEY